MASRTVKRGSKEARRIDRIVNPGRWRVTDWQVLVMIAGIVGSIGTGVYLGQKEMAERDAQAAAHFSQCLYLGSRIPDGLPRSAIYRYRCGGVIEESRGRYR